MPAAAHFILASRSPRRLSLLAQIGIDAEPRPSDIDETPLIDERAADYVLRLAREKALACRAGADDIVLAADTAVVIDGQILGKPADRADAASMLRRLAGRSHQVMTGMALSYQTQRENFLVTTEVTFGPLSEAQIQAYLATGDADDKAGAYGIQGWAAQFVSRISGSYSSVVGLPLYEVAATLREWGLLEDGSMQESDDE